jgi:hypothetical protein
MAKIARPALAKAIHLVKQDWTHIAILSIKYYVLVFCAYLIVIIPLGWFLGAETIKKVYLPTTVSGALVVETLPSEMVFLALIVMHVILPLISAWLLSPLYISLSRSAILGEPFNRHLLSRLTDHRTLRVAKILWLTIFLLVPPYSSVFFLANIDTGLAAIIGIFYVFYMFFYFYVVLRLYYLIPAVSIDRSFASMKEAWAITQGRAWAVLKVLILTTVALMGVLLLFAVIGYLAWLIPSRPIFLFVACILGVLSVLVLFLVVPQVMMASVANVYKLSQEK